MKYLVVGLGNIGEEYVGTRHNIGFEIVDQLAKDLEGVWKTVSLGSMSKVKAKGRTYYLLKPSTYMNRSGKAVRFWMSKLKIKEDKVIIITDDKNLPFGKIRIREKGSDGGHNGLKDIQQQLNTNKYPRLRFGIGSDFSKGRQVDYVLGKWNEQESSGLSDRIKVACDAIISFGFIGLSRTMNSFNNK